MVAKSGGHGRAADALGVTKQHISRVLKGEGGLGIVAIVRAALLTGRDVPRTLRELGQDDAADVLTSGFGGGMVSRTQRKILDRLDALPAPVRRHLLGLIESWPET